ncbi:hypothetical protein B0J13DRAFT_644741 [Dactylonectria estremocensis]|uniref:ABC transmembrane type-1 domain-containing protein n=1 Tax=Dactylonectria estremocensis TaxID=1079267 RepID=A0A9P9E1N4_9HYPO|nr:hypothetical protein B0J13DRAFT_644741 [Dactylonectria estremocensis]
MSASQPCLMSPFFGFWGPSVSAALMTGSWLIWIYYYISPLPILPLPLVPLSSTAAHRPVAETDLLSRVTLTWLSPLLDRAASGAVKAEDLWPVDQPVSVRLVTATEWDPSVRGLSSGIIDFIARRHKRGSIFGAVLGFIESTVTMIQPFLLQKLPVRRDALAVSAMLVASIILAVSGTHAIDYMKVVALGVKAQLTAEVGVKSLHLAPRTSSWGAVPSVLIESDINNVAVSICAPVYILGWQSVLAGSIPAARTKHQHMIRIMGRRMLDIMQAKDSRVACVTETLARIKPLKLYGWQSYFIAKINQLRVAELTMVARVAWHSDGHLESQVVFSCIAFLTIISRTMLVAPGLMILYYGATTSYDRVLGFLQLPQREGSGRNQLETGLSESSIHAHEASVGTPVLETDTSDNLLLTQCNPEAQPKALVVITGPVGEIPPCNGQVRVQGTIAFAPQQPFLIAATARESILFGQVLDKAWYREVVDAYQLRGDFARLPDGDATVLGGSRVTLSGGQGSRVTLAGFVYSRRSIVVLDDPLAVVDTKVARKLTTNVPGPEGPLKHKLCVVATSPSALIEPSSALDVGQTENERTPLLRKNKSSPIQLIDGDIVTIESVMRVVRSTKPYGWIIVVILSVATKVLDVLSVNFLRLGTEASTMSGLSVNLLYFGRMSLLSACAMFFLVMAAYHRCQLPPSRDIYNRLTGAVMKSKMSFFDREPMGELLNRFTNYINKIGTLVSGGTIKLASGGASLAMALIILVAMLPLSAAYLEPLVDGCRQLRKLENDARGLILDATNEIQVHAFQNCILTIVNAHVRVWAPWKCLDCWLLLRLSLLSLSAISLVAFEASLGTTGLVMNYMLQITTLLTFFAQTAATLEADMGSIQRIERYVSNAVEDTLSSVSDRQPIVPPPSWPLSPRIRFHHFSASYASGMTLCLRDLNFTINPGERVAVVERTGAGKSSLVLALMRALDCVHASGDGWTEIDGLDISRVRLSDLRASLAVVPQEAVTFSGSLRDNLHPYSQSSDDDRLHDLSTENDSNDWPFG